MTELKPCPFPSDERAVFYTIANAETSSYCTPYPPERVVMSTGEIAKIHLWSKYRTRKAIKGLVEKGFRVVKWYKGLEAHVHLRDVVTAITGLPPAQPEIIRCKDCKWWDREAEDSPMGYCHACKHGHYSRHWEIRIIRTYEEDFFCADAEPKEEGEEDD